MLLSNWFLEWGGRRGVRDVSFAFGCPRSAGCATRKFRLLYSRKFSFHVFRYRSFLDPPLLGVNLPRLLERLKTLALRALRLAVNCIVNYILVARPTWESTSVVLQVVPLGRNTPNMGVA